MLAVNPRLPDAQQAALIERGKARGRVDLALDGKYGRKFSNWRAARQGWSPSKTVERIDVVQPRQT